jgi:hypothetical protein
LKDGRILSNDAAIIAIGLSSHKTMLCFKRYNLVTEDELAQIKWPFYGNSGEAKEAAQSGDNRPGG